MFNNPFLRDKFYRAFFFVKKTIFGAACSLYSCLVSALCFALQLQAQVQIVLESVPDGANRQGPIYIAGNFNNWNPADPAYRLTLDAEGRWTISFTPPLGKLAFKFTGGDWSSVEGDAAGKFIPDRRTFYSGLPLDLRLRIAGWEHKSEENGSTQAANVQVLEDFGMPQLGKSRRIRIYLPLDYAAEPEKRYPVLYMHDGQNVFDKKSAFNGEWGIDESLNARYSRGEETAIVVAIDNGGADRIREYSPWIHPQYGGGAGDAYAQFIVQTLKPYIDLHYRTLASREFTGIMGSSMGGLISLHIALRYQEVFSRIGVFSPSLWFDPDCYREALREGRRADMRFYFLAGDKEGAYVVSDVRRMQDTLVAAGFRPAEILVSTHADGEHAEWYWRREFPEAFAWLFDGREEGSAGAVSDDWIIQPGPVEGQYAIRPPDSSRPAWLELRDQGDSVLLRQEACRPCDIQTKGFPSGAYRLQLSQDRVHWFSKELILH